MNITFLVCNRCDRRKPIVKFRKALRSQSGKLQERTQCYECEKQYFAISNARIKMEVFSHYSEGYVVCACCGEDGIDFLTLDHIENDGAVKRKNGEPLGSGLYRYLIKNNYPSGFQVLCWNCNCGKRINKGICPHQNQ